VSHLSHGGSAAGEFPVALTLLAFTALLYLRGWFRLRSTTQNVTSQLHLASFLIGLSLIWVAVGSPLAALDHRLLTVHMIQHLLLMSLAAPLIVLSQPVLVMARGLPQQFVRAARPWSQRPLVRQIGRATVNPVLCWLAATAALVGWHVPEALALGMRSHGWHVFQHASFLGTGLLFWWPVVQPWPGEEVAGWSVVLYLFLATLPCDVLSGFLVFSERIVYPAYLAAPNRSSLSVFQDQQAAGALMWTVVTIVYLVAGTVVATRLLSPRTVVVT
jgi:cytochrome c oxidase assembly factor CtaG